MGRVSSFFDNPNQFAAYLNILLPFLVAFLLCGEGSRWIWGTLTGLLGLAALAAQSRAAVLAGAFAVVVLLGLWDWEPV